MASSAQQTNGANTLIVSSSIIPQQLSSVNSSAALVNSQPSLIAASNPFLHVLNPHDSTINFPHIYQPQMFLQPQAGLTLQQNSAIHNANELSQLTQMHQINQSLAKKKVNKPQKIMSKTSPQLVRSVNNQLNANQAVIKSGGNILSGQQFTTQNNQAVVFSQMSNMLNTQQSNKKILDAQKNKQIVSLNVFLKLKF